MTGKGQNELYSFGGSGFIGTHLIHLLLKECVRPGDVIYDLDLVMPGEEGVVPGVVEKNDGVQLSGWMCASPSILRSFRLRRI